MRTLDSELLTRLQKNLIGNSYAAEEQQDIENDIICAFEDAEYDGETEVMLSDDEYISDNEYKVEAYLNHSDATIFSIFFRVENNTHKIFDVTM